MNTYFGYYCNFNYAKTNAIRAKATEYLKHNCATIFHKTTRIKTTKKTTTITIYY